MTRNTNTNEIRTVIEGKFEPPIDVLLDPSLLVAHNSLERLLDSTVFESQMQATLGGRPTEPRIGELYVPAALHELIESGEQLDVQKTSTWRFYRGQAEAALRSDILDVLERNDVERFTIKTDSIELNWERALDDTVRQERLTEILEEEYSFLQSGGLVLSRTPKFHQALRDAGVPMIDIGGAELTPRVQETLTDIGYEDPASICAFGVSVSTSTIDALVGGVLSTKSDLLLYRVGS